MKTQAWLSSCQVTPSLRVSSFPGDPLSDSRGPILGSRPICTRQSNENPPLPESILFTGKYVTNQPKARSREGEVREFGLERKTLLPKPRPLAHPQRSQKINLSMLLD